MAELRLKQMQGQTDQIQANKSEDHMIDAHEAHLVHAELELPEFDRTTGAKKSEPFIQKFSEREFKTSDEAGHFMGYKVNIIHDPSFEVKVTNDFTKAAQAKAITPAIPPTPPIDLESGDQGGIVIPTKEELMKMKKDDLQEKHKELYGEEMDGTREQIADAIIEKLTFLKEDAEVEKGGEGEGEGAGE